MRYAIMKYLRISSEDIDLDGPDKYESNSIAHQRALLDDFISKMPEFGGCDILEAVDDGRTGTNFNRPGVQEVIDFAQRGKVQCIVVKDLSRFGRNYLEVGDYLEQLFPTWGVRFISVTDMYDSGQLGGTTGGINIAFRNLIAELYSQDLSDKVRTAKETISRSGKSCAPYAFYGYSIDPNDHHRLIIDEPAAEIVRLIFNLREQGLTTPKIARKLNGDGVQTASERKKAQGAKRDWPRNSKVRMWDTGFIAQILADERYVGKHIYGKKRRVELGKSIYKAVPRSEWIIVPGAIPAIISEAQFKRVREIMRANTKEKTDKPTSKNLPFYRKIFCGACGRSLVRALSGGGYKYYCSTPSVKGGLGCMHGSIREDDVAATVLTVIRQQAQLADRAKSFMTENAKSSFTELVNLRGEAQNLQRLIDKANSTKLSLWEKQHTGSLSMVAYQRENEKVAAQITAYTERIAELETQIRRLEMESGQENTFALRFSKQVGIQELSKAVVDEFIKAVRVYAPDRIEIILNYSDEYSKIAQHL